VFQIIVFTIEVPEKGTDVINVVVYFSKKRVSTNNLAGVKFV